MRERMSLKRFIDRYITLGSEQKLSCVVDVDGAQAKLGEPIPVVLAGNVNSAGTIQGNSATGTVPVTEASAANIYAAQAVIQTGVQQLTAADPSLNYPACLYSHHRIFTVNIPIAAGGAVTNIPLHQTLAGYKFHFKVLGMWSSVADITTTWWFHTTAGAVSCVGCPATPGFVVTALAAADTLYNPLNGAYMNNGAATGDVTLLDVAGVGAGAANLYIFLEGWFETT